MKSILEHGSYDTLDKHRSIIGYKGGEFLMFKSIIYATSDCLLIRDGDLIALQFIHTGYLALFHNATGEEIRKIIDWLRA